VPVALDRRGRGRAVRGRAGRPHAAPAGVGAGAARCHDSVEFCCRRTTFVTGRRF